MIRKKALITGGEFGMGRGIVLELAKNGYDIAFSYYPEFQNADAAVKMTQKLLEKEGAAYWTYATDLSKPEAAKELFQKAVNDMQGLDLMVNNAGVNFPEPLQELTEEKVDYLLTLDFRTYIMMMHYASKYMIDNNIQGSIINITSSRGTRAYPNAGIYCGIKAGLNHMAEAFALDVAGYGIRINNVAPGATRIRTKEELLNMKSASETDYYWEDEFLDNPDAVQSDFWDRLGKKIPLQRSGTPQDIGRAVAFLASDQASYITGVTLRVDGGLILPGMPEDPNIPGNGWK